MNRQKFQPKEILFSPTTQCNLNCLHCDIKRNPKILSKDIALRFLSACKKAGIKRVGFTGGEPFLALDFLCAIIKKAIEHQMLFSRIMTNGVWFKSRKRLIFALNRIFRAGFDGDFCVSVDAFHRQDLKKVAYFIRTALEIWKRPDVVSIAAVKGSRQGKTRVRLLALAHALNARLSGYPEKHAYIKNSRLFIRILTIELAACARAASLKNPWKGKWFRDDFCRGPGNVFFVLPDATVKPCCGYATDTDMLTIGSIKRDSPHRILQNAHNNRFVNTIFNSGLHLIRRKLESTGVRLPGETSNHCVFCYYLTHYLPRTTLEKCLKYRK